MQKLVFRRRKSSFVHYRFGSKMQEDYYESIHPPDLIHFDGRRTPDSTCSSLSSPGNSPLPREHQGGVISPATTRTVILTKMNSAIPHLPFDEHAPRADEMKIDVLSQQYEEEEEEEPGRIMNCASPRSNGVPRKSITREYEEKKSETPSLFDEAQQLRDFITPSFPRENEDFDDLALAPTDEKMAVTLKNSRQMDAGPLTSSPEIEQQGVLGKTALSNNKSESFDEERFENPSFTPDKKEMETSMSMFQSLANVTMSAALHIENLILGPSDPPATPEQPSWYAKNKDTREEIFSSIASPLDKANLGSVDETPSTSRVWTEAGSSPDVWRAEKDMLDKCKTDSQSPDESIEYTPVKISAVVRRSFGAETLTSAFEEDAPADESGRALSGGFQTPVSLNAPADELRTSQRRPIDPPSAKDAPREKIKAEVSSERLVGENTLTGVAVNPSFAEVASFNRNPPSPHQDTSTKKPDSEKLKPRSLSIETGDQPLDERRQDKNSPIRLAGTGDAPDDEPAALIPKKVQASAESAWHGTVIEFQKTPSASEQIGSPEKMQDACEEPPELKRATNSASPILHNPDPSADRQGQQISGNEDGYRSDGTDNLLGSLQVLMDDLDDMARKRSIRVKPDQSTSFHSCVSSVQDGLNSSMMSTRGYASPSKSVDTLQDGLPFRINMLNNDLGIPIGDVIISLLNEEDADKSWVARVNEAVWRCRIVRRNCDTKWLKGKLKKNRDSSGLDKSSSFANSGDSRILEKSIQEIQAAAIQHLKYDELNDAVCLYTEILDRYMSYIPTMQALPDSNYKLRHLGVYIGIAKYDLGVINMLRGEFVIACGLFEKAATMLSHEASIDQLVGYSTCKWPCEDLTHNYFLLFHLSRLFETKLRRA